MEGKAHRFKHVFFSRRPYRLLPERKHPAILTNILPLNLLSIRLYFILFKK